MRFLVPLISLALAVPAFGVDPKELKPGLIGTYTNATAVTRLDPVPALTLTANVSSNVKWSGFIYIVTPGNYTFSANLLGGDLQIKVGETEVFRSDRTSNGKPATLIAGPYKFLAIQLRITIFLISILF